MRPTEPSTIGAPQPPAAEADGLQLSAEQRRFYALHQLDPGDPEIYLCRTLRIAGWLEAARLRASVAALAQRHDLLRATYPLPAAGQPQLVLRDEVDAAVTAIDLSLLPAAERAGRAALLVAAETGAGRPMSLETGPLFRVLAVQLEVDEHVVVLRFHHLIADGVSVEEFLRDLWETYAALAPEPRQGEGRRGEAVRQDELSASRTPPAAQYRDFVRWEQRRQTDEARAADRAYWAHKLARPPAVDLAAALAPAAALGRPRPPRHTREAATVHAALSEPLRAALHDFCRAQRVTPYVALLAVLQRLLHQLTGEGELLVATPIANRQRREFLPVLGVMVGWIVTRAQLRPEQSFLELVGAARRELSESFVHQSSYEALLAAARAAPGGPPRDASRNPLAQVTLNYARPAPLPAPEDLLIELDPVEVPATTYDLALRFEERGERCTLGLTYYAGAIDRAAAERLCAAYLALAEHSLRHPQLPLADAGAPRIERAAARPASSEQRRRLAIAATFTAEPVAPILNAWLDRLGLPCELVFAPAHRVLEQLIDPAGLLAHDALGCNALLLRCEDWKDPAAAVEECARLLAAHAERSAAPTLVVLCPPSPQQRGDAAEAAAHQRLAQRLAEVAAAAPPLHFLPWEELVERYPVDELDDVEADAYAGAPYSADFFAALATAIARWLHAALRPAPKVLVLDCDHTLWRGVVGEDGPHGVVVEEGHRALQQFAAAQHAAGVLLCLASKNDEADVWAAFAAAPGMILRREQLAAHRIDWAPKSQNLHGLAAELGLGVDAFAFLDDSPVECAEVRAGCPGALVWQLPARPAELPHFLQHLWPLDRRKLTDADRQRPARYAADARRQQARREVPDLAQFLASLELKVTFAPLTRQSLARIAQLSQRTNQFNTTAVRRSEAELWALYGGSGGEIMLVDVVDRFGDYGLVGAVSYRCRGATLEVDAWMLSCRALGRGVEHRILAELGRRAQERGCEELAIAYRPTAKNQPAHRFLESIAAPRRVDAAEPHEPHERFEYRLSATAAQRATVQQTATTTEPTPAALAPPPVAPSSFSDELHALWQQLPEALDTVAKIRRAFAAAEAQPRTAPSVFVAPRDELERAIATAWSEVLLVAEIGVDDDYFAIGGDSIRSLAVAAQLRAAGLAVTVLELHDHPTVAALAELVRSRRASPTTPTTPTTPTAPTSPPRPEPSAGPYPLAFAQRYVVAAYARHNLQAGRAPSGAFHLQDRFTVRQQRPVSLTALRRAVAELVGGAAPLHTRLLPDEGDEGGDGWRQLQLRPPAKHLDSRHVLGLLDLRPLAEPEQQAQLAALLDDDRRRPFDPARSDAPLLRAYAALTGERSFELIISAHHGFCDGWSLQAAYTRLFQRYQAHAERDLALEVATPALAGDGDLRELVQREQEAAASPASRQFWRAHRPIMPPAPSTPLDVETAPRARHTLLLPPSAQLFAHASARAHASRTSLKAVFLEAFAAALVRCADARAQLTSPASAAPLLLAVVTNGRKEDLARPMELFGLCWTLTPITFPIGTPLGTPIGALAADEPLPQLTALHRQLLATEAHCRFPVEEMFGGDPAALACASFNLTNFHNAGWRDEGAAIQITKREAFHHFGFPLELDVRLDEREHTATLKLGWRDGVCDEPTARALLNDLTAWLVSGEAARLVSDEAS